MSFKIEITEIRPGKVRDDGAPVPSFVEMPETRHVLTQTVDELDVAGVIKVINNLHTRRRKRVQK